jgi:putative endonuclease
MYVLECGDHSLYTGMTNNVARRLAEHQAGRGGHYTRAHQPVSLRAVWSYPSRSAAMRAEARFKRLRRKKKLAYITSRDAFLAGAFATQVVSDLAF